MRQKALVKNIFKYPHLFLGLMEKNLKIAQIKKIAVPILKKNGVVKAGIFGSYARGEEQGQSDIDFLIDIRGKKSLLDIVGLQLSLQDKLKRGVDLVEYQEIHPSLKRQIMREEVRVL